MKNLLLITACVLFASFTYSQQTRKTLYITKVNMLDDPKANKYDLSDFISGNYIQKAKIDSFTIEKVKKKYFLLARDSENGKTYALRLWNNGDKLYATILYHLDACTCDCMDISQFVTENNRVVGCKNAAHIIAGAY